MDKKEIIEKVNRFLTNEIEIEEDLITPEALLTKDLGIDSLDVIDIIVIVEQVFNVKIKGEELKNVKTLQEFYNFVERKINSK
ncbi:MAG: phosphopantetheine-binding protein [Bacteroidales bacterium]|nr:phosphopantetheine-binding protein [Bacteroidales bacterium]